MSTGTKRKADEPSSNVAEAKKPKADGNIASFFKAAAPKTNNSSDGASSAPGAAGPTAPAIHFDKDKWVASLTDEHRELLKLEIDTLHDSWLAHLKDDVRHPSFLELKRFLKREKENGAKVFPPEADIYSW